MHLNDRFARRRRTAETEAYTNSYEQAQQLMARREIFDVTREPARDLERYGAERLRPPLPAGSTAAQSRALRSCRSHTPITIPITRTLISISSKSANSTGLLPPHRRPGGAGAFAAHAGRRHVGIRTNSQHQLSLRPRPLEQGVEHLPGRCGVEKWCTLSARPIPEAPKSLMPKSAAVHSFTPTSARSSSTLASRLKSTAVRSSSPTPLPGPSPHCSPDILPRSGAFAGSLALYLA